MGAVVPNSGCGEPDTLFSTGYLIKVVFYHFIGEQWPVEQPEGKELRFQIGEGDDVGEIPVEQEVFSFLIVKIAVFLFCFLDIFF